MKTRTYYEVFKKIIFNTYPLVCNRSRKRIFGTVEIEPGRIRNAILLIKSSYEGNMVNSKPSLKEASWSSSLPFTIAIDELATIRKYEN